MTHLSQQQLEQILQQGGDNEHLAVCRLCRQKLAEKRALARRLRAAFESVEPEPEFVAGLKRRLDTAAAAKCRTGCGFWQMSRVGAVAAVAAILAMAVLVVNYAVNPAPAMAASAELARIHNHNISEDDLHYTDGSYEQVAEYFTAELGFTPSMPTSGNGMKLRGCCVRYFRGRVAGSYVVDTPQGIISVVVVGDTPESMSMEHNFVYHGNHLWKDSFEHNNIVTIRLGDYSYCAVGDVSAGYLADLLLLLVAEDE